MKLQLKYNPYRLETEILVDGEKLEENSILHKCTLEKRLQEWIEDFPNQLKREYDIHSIEEFEFIGSHMDYEDVMEVMENSGIQIENFNFRETTSNDIVLDKIKVLFKEVVEGPVEELRTKSLLNSYAQIDEAIFPISVVATMSSGKSTLINSLLNERLMPAKNEACTAIITEIIDNDDTIFNATAYNSDGKKIETLNNVNYEDMDKLNSNLDVRKVVINGDIPFVDAKDMTLKLIDTPGPNNSRDENHRETTYRTLNNNSNDLILYILNATQLSTNDDKTFLEYVSEQMKNGTKDIRDRFLFVVNKMDNFNPDEESIERVLQNVKSYLNGYGIENPQIFPVSAYTALNIRTHLKDIDIDNLSNREIRQLPVAAKDTISMIGKFVDYEDLHLEKYAPLTAFDKKIIENKISEAKAKNDEKELALIHSGIYSLELAIKKYVKKYAKTSKIKNLVDLFEVQLEANKVVQNLKINLTQNEENIIKLKEKTKIIQEKISNGESAKDFKDKIEALDPSDEIEKQAMNLMNSVNRKLANQFNSYGEYIYDEEKVIKILDEFFANSNDEIAKLTVDLENLINQEIIEVGKNYLSAYEERIKKIDEEVKTSELEFSILDLVKGNINNVVQNVEQMRNFGYINETVNSVGEKYTEIEEHIEVVGKEIVQVKVGTEKTYIGKEKVKVGSHQEKVGTKQVETGKSWWQFWKPKYKTVDVYETVDEFEERDVYKDIDVFEEREYDIVEKIEKEVEKFRVKVQDLSGEVLSELQVKLSEMVKEIKTDATYQVEDMKMQFVRMFDELDDLIKQKYDELNQYVEDAKNNEKEIERTKDIIYWLEENKKELNEILSV